MLLFFWVKLDFTNYNFSFKSKESSKIKSNSFSYFNKFVIIFNITIMIAVIKITKKNLQLRKRKNLIDYNKQCT